MNKYLVSLLLLFICADAFALVPVETFGTEHVAKVENLDRIRLEDITDTVADKYVISNSSVVINNFSDWQNWVATVEFTTDVKLYINNIDSVNSGTKVAHLTSDDLLHDITIKDSNGLYRTSFTAVYDDVFLNLVRETNYQKVFKDSRGTFLENLRSNNQNNKMLAAMDRASNMNQINSIMNSSYHFNPSVLMNPIKTINRANMLNFLTKKQGSNSGADIDVLFSNKINNYGGHIYFADKYDDLYFKIGGNINRFSYQDDTNEFDGISYGLDISARQYLDLIWLDGIIGINRTSFNTDDIYVNGNVSNNPNGVSEYVRFDIGYDYTKISEVVISPFVGIMFQNVDIMDERDSDIDLHAGTMAKYNFISDGIKYEYGATTAINSRAYWNLGLNAGFISVMDNAGAFIAIDMFKDEFDMNYKLSLNAKVQF